MKQDARTLAEQDARKWLNGTLESWGIALTTTQLDIIACHFAQQWIKITDDPQFLRRWYEQLKADDPHHCAEHDGEHGDDFSTYSEYTFELFRESRIVKAGLKAISPTWVRIDGPNSLPPDEQLYEFIVGPNIVGIGLCRKGQWMVPDPHEETDFREVHGVRYWREIGPLPAPPEEHQ